MNENTKILIEYLRARNFQVTYNDNPSQEVIDLIKKRIEESKKTRGE